MPYKVIFVPGVPGTDLHEPGVGGSLGNKVFPPRPIKALLMKKAYREKIRGPNDLAAPLDLLPGKPITSTELLGLDLSKQAEGLYRILGQCGLGDGEIAKVGWDWRRPVTCPDTLGRLEQAVSKSVDKVVIIAHSTGGLVVRHLLENNSKAAARVGRVIAFGVPWAGTLKAFAALVGQQAFGPIGKKDAQDIFAYVWSAYDLLPRKNSAGLVVDANGDPINPLTANAWMPTEGEDKDAAREMRKRAQHSMRHLGQHRRTWKLDGIPVINLVGWGEETKVLARVAGRTVTFNAGLQPEPKRLGDGTVPLGSAAWLQGDVTTLSIPIGGYPRSGKEPHSTLWRNPGGADMVRHILRAPSLTEFAYAAVDWSDKLDPSRKTVRVRFVLQSLGGKALTGGTARLANVRGNKQAGIDAAGRGMITVARGDIPKVHGERLRRLVVELDWPGAAKPKPQTLVVAGKR